MDYVIVNGELQHHGILGMRWGIRRTKAQLARLNGGKGKKGGKDSEKKEETREEKRARLLKSTNAAELYKDRDVLTTAEINERLNRIDTEKRLKAVADSTKKSGMDHVNNFIKVVKKADEVYQLTNTSLGKAIKKSLGLETEKIDKAMDLADAYNNRNKLSDKQLGDALRRANTEKAMKKILDEADKENTAKVKDDSKTTKEKTKADIHDAPDKSGPQKHKEPEIIDADFTEVTTAEVKNSPVTQNGQKYVNNILEAPKKKDDDD